MSTFFIIAYYFCALNLANKGLLIFHFRSRLETFYCRFGLSAEISHNLFSKKPNRAIFVARKTMMKCCAKPSDVNWKKRYFLYLFFLSKLKLSEIFSEKLCPMFFSVHHSIFFEFAWIKMLFVSFGSFYWFFLFKLVLSFFFHKIILF